MCGCWERCIFVKRSYKHTVDIMSTRLPRHVSQNQSDPLLTRRTIPILRPRDVVILDEKPGGDAPKRMVRIYEYQQGSNTRRINFSSWPKYIAKTAEKWHPVEGVTEYIINLAGLSPGLPMNDFRLFRYNGTIWFCSRYFLRPHLGEALIHGTEICGDYLQDHDLAKEIADNQRDARELFKFEFIEQGISSVFGDLKDDLLLGLVRILVFDCLLGNNDRHFYNWGVIHNVRTRKVIGIAPTYDSSRGLFWNNPDDTIRQKASGRNGLEGFIEKYAKNTMPRMTCDANQSVNHFQLIKHLASLKPAYAEVVRHMAHPTQEAAVLSSVSEVTRPLFSAYRVEAITKLLTLRFQKTREALES